MLIETVPWAIERVVIPKSKVQFHTKLNFDQIVMALFACRQSLLYYMLDAALQVNMFLQPTALVVWLLLRLLLMVFVGPALPARSARAPPDTVSAKRELRVLVLLPEKSGENKFPFGSEMCGAAGANPSGILFINTSHQVPRGRVNMQLSSCYRASD